jgi:hypothetical protein
MRDLAPCQTASCQIRLQAHSHQTGIHLAGEEAGQL